MRDLDQFAVLGLHPGFGLVENILERRQHQGQRCAEFVADIGEERGLGAVDLGERVGASAFLLVGLGIGNGCTDRSGDEIEKAGIFVVVEPVWIETGNEHAGASGVAAGSDRQHHGLLRRPVPGAARQFCGKRGGLHAERRVRAHRLGEGPGPVARDELLRRGSMAAIRRTRAHQRRAGAVLVDDVEQREGQIAVAGLERRDALLAGLLPGARLRRLRRQFAQQFELAFADDAVGVVGVGAEDAGGKAGIVADRAVGEGVVGFFRIAVALHDQELRLHVSADRTLPRLRQHGADVAPDLAPHLPRRFAERPRMLAADDRLIGIVIEIDELFAPADPDRLLRGEHDTDGGLERARPALGRAERGRGPVERAQQAGQLAGARENLLGGLTLRAAARVLQHRHLRRPPGLTCNEIQRSADGKGSLRGVI